MNHLSNHSVVTFTKGRCVAMTMLLAVLLATCLPQLSLASGPDNPENAVRAPPPEPSQTASAQTSEIIRNGGFETGDLTGWTVEVEANVTTQDAHTGSYCVALEGMTTLSQGWQPAMWPPGNLTFWAKTTSGMHYDDIAVVINYNDDTWDSYSLSFPGLVWTYYSVMINVTKGLSRIDIMTGEQTYGLPMLFDDVSVRAPVTPPSFARDTHGYFRWMKDVPSAVYARIEISDNILNPEIILGERVSVLGELEDPTHDGWILLEVETVFQTLHYEFQVKAHARADFWPMAGKSPSHTGLSVSTVPQTNRTRWSNSTSSAIQFSPAIADDLVFLARNDGITALNETTGAQLWQFARTVTSSPAVADGRVFFGATDGLYALNETTGTPAWRFQTTAPVNSSPIVTAGLVIFGCDDHIVYALNATDKSISWSFLADGPVHTSPCTPTDPLADPRPTPIVLFGSETTMYAVHLANGTLIWSQTRNVRSSPTVADGAVFFGCADGVYALNFTDGTPLWRFQTSQPVYSSPAVADGMVFFGCNDHYIYALNATDKAVIWSVDVGEEVRASPIVAGERVIWGKLLCIGDCRDKDTGQLIWQFETSGAIAASPVLAYGHVFFGDVNGNLYCLGPEHDVAVNLVQTSKTVVGQGYRVKVEVAAENLGGDTESFYLSAQHGGMIDEYPIVLAPGASTIIPFDWLTSGFEKGNYTITGAHDWPVPGETETSNNILVGGWVFVTIPGDVDGDRYVNIFDIVHMAGVYGVKAPNPQYVANYDIEGDGDTDIFDIVIAASHYGDSW